MYITQETCSKQWLEIFGTGEYMYMIANMMLACLLFSPQKRPTTAVKIQCNFPNFLPFVKKIFHLPTIREICMCVQPGGRRDAFQIAGLRKSEGRNIPFHMSIWVIWSLPQKSRDCHNLYDVRKNLRSFKLRLLKLRLYLVVF